MHKKREQNMYAIKTIFNSMNVNRTEKKKFRNLMSANVDGHVHVHW